MDLKQTFLRPEIFWAFFEPLFIQFGPYYEEGKKTDKSDNLSYVCEFCEIKIKIVKDNFRY
jgi:hypothetical protein